ncbi:hypothetical protein [Paenarthrobacter sp. 4246]|uniref:hypothetical protein n=1 Tax=Paenarthrobacter sp. 4246 TaxID=3156456 RepID=UPI003393A0F8
MQSIGTEFLENQKKLSDFKYWITQLRGIYEAGYVEQVNDAATLSTKVLWKGPSDLRDTVASEGKARGITVTFAERPYSVAEIDAAVNLLLAQKPSFEALGFKVESVGGIRDDDGQIEIEGHALTSPALKLAADQRAAVETSAQAIAKVPVRVIDGVRVAAATRMNDTSPFNSGAYMLHSTAYNGCSTGFALAYSRDATYTNTARHCRSGYWNARDNSNTSLGLQWRDSPDGQAVLLSERGSKWMFDGAWNNSAGYSKAVSGYHDVSLGDRVCTSGGNSGVHCNIGISKMGHKWNDGYGEASQIEGFMQTAGAISAIEGDSGGPVLVPYGNGTVGAAGMIQAIVWPWTSGAGCGSVRDGGGNLCSGTVWFTSTRTIASSLGMILVTW